AESFSALFNVVSMMGVGCGSPHPWGAFGPVMITSVADYLCVGGHDAVAHEVTEDLALAAEYRRAGLPLTIRLGRGAVRYRMYPNGFRSLVEGWTKNMATGANHTPWPRLVAVAAWVSALASLSLEVVVALTATSPPGWPPLALAALAAAQLALFCRVAGRFGWWVPVAFPVQVVVFVAVFLRSVWRTTVSGTVTWKGRTLDARPGP
ncbi:MAG TPA: hypothetical protein VJM33_08070, partial [Microthrixaceae bacterium]|nr:hypothetical protein [Microthrixaceae bacterium]